jgi:hypothetical protein
MKRREVPRGYRPGLYVRAWQWADIWLRPRRWKWHFRRLREWWYFERLKRHYSRNPLIKVGKLPKGKVVPMTAEEQAELAKVWRDLNPKPVGWALPPVDLSLLEIQTKMIRRILRSHGYDESYDGRIGHVRDGMVSLIAYIPPTNYST